jgi:hypothetical protein
MSAVSLELGAVASTGPSSPSVTVERPNRPSRHTEGTALRIPHALAFDVRANRSSITQRGIRC